MSRMDEKRYLETSRGVLEFTAIGLINQVERHPVIWNRLHEDFKKREAIDNAWDKIGAVFVPFYDELDEDERQSIIDTLQARWKNCVSGIMTSASLKRKNDRLFRPYKYAREMEFYLKTRGIKLADIYDAQEIDGIEDTLVKKESHDEEQSMEEDEVENELDTEVAEPAPKNKKNKNTDTSMTFRSARLREKQDKIPPKIIAITPINTKQRQIKKTPVSINNSACSNSSRDVEEYNEKEDIPYNSTPQSKKPKTSSVAINHSVHVTPISQPPTLTNESDETDQAFFDSIKPALRKMSETQKLDFQIDILQILKTFRSN
ncbi:uncharacterized protein LOC135963762 [Calliphora vicina]|uniref:uncharacterized protein LOC135963762 n=1 Tax=Calliphora vicina TaxID=7373 RepID=UPI00325A754A